MIQEFFFTKTMSGFSDDDLWYSRFPFVLVNNFPDDFLPHKSYVFLMKFFFNIPGSLFFSQTMPRWIIFLLKMGLSNDVLPGYSRLTFVSFEQDSIEFSQWCHWVVFRLGNLQTSMMFVTRDHLSPNKIEWSIPLFF